MRTDALQGAGATCSLTRRAACSWPRSHLMITGIDIPVAVLGPSCSADRITQAGATVPEITTSGEGGEAAKLRRAFEALSQRANVQLDQPQPRTR